MMPRMLNSELSQRCVVDGNSLARQSSPSSQFQSRFLVRNGGGVARATSTVQYDAGAKCSSHANDLAEEIYRVQGILSDEHGRYTPIRTLSMPAVNVFDLIRTKWI